MADNPRFDKLEAKIDGISEDIVEIKLIMARNTSSLEEHMRRSDLNEEAVRILKSELKPVEDHVKKVEGVTSFLLITAKVLGGIAAGISILAAIYTLLK